MDFPWPSSITKETVRQVKKDSESYRGSVRFATGRIMTDEEYRKRRDTLRSKTLP